MASAAHLFRRIRGDALGHLSRDSHNAGHFQAWCYNTGSHPAISPLQLWGIFPVKRCKVVLQRSLQLRTVSKSLSWLAPGILIPFFWLSYLKLFVHAIFRAITSVSTVVMALTTWSVLKSSAFA